MKLNVIEALIAIILFVFDKFHTILTLRLGAQGVTLSNMYFEGSNAVKTTSMGN